MRKISAKWTMFLKFALRSRDFCRSDEIGLGIVLPISEKKRAEVFPIGDKEGREIRAILHSLIDDARVVASSTSKNFPDELKPRLKMIAGLMKKIREEISDSQKDAAGNRASR